MGGWRDAPKALPQRPPTPPVEKWDCEIEEEEAAAAAAAAKESSKQEEEENWDTASED